MIFMFCPVCSWRMFIHFSCGGGHSGSLEALKSGSEKRGADKPSNISPKSIPTETIMLKPAQLEDFL